MNVDGLTAPHHTWMMQCEQCRRATDTVGLHALLAAPLPTAYTPDIRFYTGWRSSNAGDFTGAAQQFHATAVAAIGNGRVVLHRRSMAWEAYVQVQCGNYATARVLTELLDEMTPLHDPLYADILFVRGLIASERDTLAEAQHWQARALAVALTFHDTWMIARCYANLAPLHGSQGHVAEMGGIIRRIEELQARSDDLIGYDRELQLANLRLHHARWAGELEQALEEGERVCAQIAAQAKQSQARSTLFSTYITLTTAATATDLGDFALAEALWEQAASYSERIKDDDRTLAELLWERAWMFYRQNNLARAQRDIDAAMRLVDGTMETECHHAYAIDALIALRRGDIDRAERSLRVANHRFCAVGHRMGISGLQLHLAARFLREGQREHGRQSLAEALVCMWSQGVYHTYYWEPAVIVELCRAVIEESLWEGQADRLMQHMLSLATNDVTRAMTVTGDAANLLAAFATNLVVKRLARTHWHHFESLLHHRVPRVRVRAAQIVQAGQQHGHRAPSTVTPSAAIQIFSFGPLRVLINGEPLRSRDAGARKAIELLAMLLIYGADGVRRDTVRWLLWPDKRNFNALNTANHGLRQAFASAFGGDKTRVRIVLQGDRYVLEWDAGALWWDWHELERIAAQPHISVRDRERAATLYTSDWMDTMLHLPLPRDASDEQQWSRVAYEVQARIEDGRETAAAWVTHIRAAG